MLSEATTLASFAALIGEVLEDEYGVDRLPLYAEAGIDTRTFERPGARISFQTMNTLWTLAAYASEDRCFGFAVGKRVKPAHFYVLGHAWLASETMLDGLQRLVRYGKVLSPALSTVTIESVGDRIAFVNDAPDPLLAQPRVADDFGFSAFFTLCDLVSRRPVRPTSVNLPFPRDAAASKYAELFRCPLSYDEERQIFYYSAEQLAEPLPGYIPDVLDATAQIARDYLSSLDDSVVATEVRRLLIQMLPAGGVDQGSIASRLHRSRTTLQRQLAAEGTSYREILEDTRKRLSEKYLQDGGYSQAEVAYIVGFSDQSNFARAFKRWTGMSPGEFQKAA